MRLGFILPAHLADLVFGAVPGFYVFRYALALAAVGPTYLLFRRLFGGRAFARGAGGVAVAVILSSPVVLNAWGTDYPDFSAVSYLIAGMVCLVIPASTRWRRAGWVAAAGIAFGLALNSHIMTAPLVAAMLAAYALVHGWRRLAATAAELLLVVVSVAAATGVLAFAALVMYGEADIISPTVDAVRVLRTAAQIRLWHSTNWRFVLSDTYLLVPPALLAAWAVVRLPRWRGVRREERILVLATALGVLAYFYVQFFADGSTLEYHLYSSMLWSGVTLTTAFLVVAACRPLLRRPWSAGVPTLLVLVVPRICVVLYRLPQFGMLWWGVVIAVAVVGLARLIPRAWSSRSKAALLATALVVALFTLTAAPLPTHPRLVGQTGLPAGHYSDVIGGDGHVELDQYRAASEPVTVVPPATGPGDSLMMWPSPGDDVLLGYPMAQYFWHVQSLPPTLPDFTAFDGAELRKRQPRLLLLMGATSARFLTAVAALQQANFSPRVIRRATLAPGLWRYSVWVVQLDRYNSSRR